MALDVGGTLSEAYRRSLQRSGVQLFAAAFALQILNAIVVQSQAAALATRARFPAIAMQYPLAFLPPTLAWILGVVLSVLYATFVVVAIRTLASDEVGSVPAEFYADDVVWPTLNVLVGGIVFGVVVVVGLVLFVIPGLFLFVSLVFYTAFVAIEGDNFFRAMSRSWGLAKGRRFSIFLLFVALLVVGFVLGIAGAVAALPFRLFWPGLAAIVNAFVSAAVTLFGLAVLARAYVRLSWDAETAPPGPAAGMDTGPGPGAGRGPGAGPGSGTGQSPGTGQGPDTGPGSGAGPGTPSEETTRSDPSESGPSDAGSQTGSPGESADVGDRPDDREGSTKPGDDSRDDRSDTN